MLLELRLDLKGKDMLCFKKKLARNWKERVFPISLYKMQF